MANEWFFFYFGTIDPRGDIQMANEWFFCWTITLTSKGIQICKFTHSQAKTIKYNKQKQRLAAKYAHCNTKFIRMQMQGHYNSTSNLSYVSKVKNQLLSTAPQKKFTKNSKEILGKLYSLSKFSKNKQKGVIKYVN